MISILSNDVDVAFVKVMVPTVLDESSDMCKGMEAVKAELGMSLEFSHCCFMSCMEVIIANVVNTKVPLLMRHQHIQTALLVNCSGI